MICKECWVSKESKVDTPSTRTVQVAQIMDAIVNALNNERECLLARPRVPLESTFLDFCSTDDCIVDVDDCSDNLASDDVSASCQLGHLVSNYNVSVKDRTFAWCFTSVEYRDMTPDAVFHAELVLPECPNLALSHAVVQSHTQIEVCKTLFVTATLQHDEDDDCLLDVSESLTVEFSEYEMIVHANVPCRKTSSILRITIRASSFSHESTYMTNPADDEKWHLVSQIGHC
jgi:hypothetical protein